MERPELHRQPLDIMASSTTTMEIDEELGFLPLGESRGAHEVFRVEVFEWLIDPLHFEFRREGKEVHCEGDKDDVDLHRGMNSSRGEKLHIKKDRILQKIRI